jgi:hypothetical protein
LNQILARLAIQLNPNCDNYNLRLGKIMGKSLWKIGIILALIFITVGDRFLPQPLSTASWKTRTSINQIFLGLIPNPNWKRPSKQREESVNQFEKKADPSRQQ